MAPARHRIKMCEIAARHDIRIKASSYEIDHRFRGETYHLLKKLLAEDFNDTYHFSWIIGLDNAIEFDKWAHPEELKEMIGFIIIPRFGVPYIPSPNDWFLRPPHIYLALDMENYPLAKVSSTMARESVAAKNWEGVSRIVAPEVLAYIRKNRLYLPR